MFGACLGQTDIFHISVARVNTTPDHQCLDGASVPPGLPNGCSVLISSWCQPDKSQSHLGRGTLYGGTVLIRLACHQDCENVVIGSQCVRAQAAVGSTIPRQVSPDCERKGTEGGAERKSVSVPSQQRSHSAAFLGGSCFRASVASAAVHHLKQTPFFPELPLVRGSHRGHRVTPEHTSTLQTEGLLFIPACMPRDEASPPSLSPLALADPSATCSLSFSCCQEAGPLPEFT